MNVSVTILLLLLLFSTCHGTAQDASGILPTTKWQKEVEKLIEVSCPNPTDIEPCVCTNNGSLTMNCSNVQNEQQLRKAFSGFFPTTQFYNFVMNDNHGVKILEDGVFGNVSFQKLYINGSVLETVKNDALTPSLSTLTDIWIVNCSLEIFPFERLAEFTSLVDLGLPLNKINTFPPLSSSSLIFLDLGLNLITYIPVDAFAHLRAIAWIYIDDNHLTGITEATFTDFPHLDFVDISGNNISHLQTSVFDFTATPPWFMLLLHHNRIEFVDVGAFKGVTGPATIDMKHNHLTCLLEDVWRPVLEKSVTVRLAGNSLTCDCSVAWLVRDPQLLTMASDAHCANGTLLTDLNPADFNHCT